MPNHTILLPLTFAGQLLASDVACPIYPPPQHVHRNESTLTLASSAKVTGAETADPGAVELLQKRLALAPATGNVTEIRIGKVGSPPVKGLDHDIPAVSGAYRITARPGLIALAGHDDRGVFYAAQSLRQLLDADANPADLPATEVLDFPTVPFRGIVEGFYDTPDDGWNHENRLALIAFCGRQKMDTYIYGPKDDPYHRSEWRKPYPADKAETIRNLVRASNAAKVNFVWALHPGGDIKWTEEDYQAAKSKLEQMYLTGVRSFAVFFDDIGGEGTRADKQAELLNRLHHEFVTTKGDITPLILCPTQYNRAWSGGDYLDTLGKSLDPSIQVMWTGNSVVADLDKESMEFINGKLRRKAYIWWNAPCNDFCRTNLNLGPAYGDTDRLPAPVRDWAKSLGQKIFGNTTEAAERMSGFTSNPMGRSEASKVGLYGVAGYTWNPKGYDATAAWERAMVEIMPKAAVPFRTFCDHNQDNGPNTHGYRRPESLRWKPLADTYLASLRTGKPDVSAGKQLREEFRKIAAAPAAIRTHAGNPELLRQINPWLDAFEALGEAGIHGLDASATTERATRWQAYSRAAGALAKLNRIDQSNNRNPWQPGVKVASLVMAPLVDGIMKTVGAAIYQDATGKPPLASKGTVSRGSSAGIEKMLDDDAASYFYFESDQQAGDAFTVELSSAAAVSRVSLVMGRKDGDHDFVKKGQLECSADGRNWTALGDATTGEAVFWEGPPVSARAVRYRALEPAKAWVAIRNFKINPATGQPRTLTSIPNLTNVPVRRQKNEIFLTPQLEVFRFERGENIGIQLPTSTRNARVEIDLKAAHPGKWAKVECSNDGTVWRPLALVPHGETALRGEIGESFRAIRLSNADQPVDAKLAAFKLILAETATAESLITDGLLATSAPIGDGRSLEIPAGTRGVTLFFGEDGHKGVKVGFSRNRSDAPSAWTDATEDLHRIIIPPDQRHLHLRGGDPAATIHEAVWR